jgi:DNA invertase Pin-like site-specific DNA recombinase
MKCVIYVRVSTKDKVQDVESQLLPQRRYATAQGWEIAEFIDHETGKHPNRAQFRALFAAASRREFDVVLVWALDRFTGEGVTQTFLQIKRLLDYGVQFESLTEFNFRTTGHAGEVIIAIAAWVAKQERVRISDRTKAGLAVARAKGRIGGRARKVFEYGRAIALRAQDPPMSWRAIARELSVPQSSIRKALQGVHSTSPPTPRKPAANND